MLTIEQLPKEVTEKIIKILNQDGVTRQSVQACAFGLACTNLGINSKEESLKRLDEVGKNRIENNKEYVHQVLTVYANAATGEMLDMAVLMYGERSPEEMEYIKSESDKAVKEIIEKYVPLMIEKA